MAEAVRINLALQGGGAHGPLTVVEQLEQPVHVLGPTGCAHSSAGGPAPVRFLGAPQFLHGVAPGGGRPVRLEGIEVREYGRGHDLQGGRILAFEESENRLDQARRPLAGWIGATGKTALTDETQGVQGER